MHILVSRGNRAETFPKHDVSTKRTFVFVALIVIAEPLSSTMLLPFVYFMVRGFGYTEQETGLRAGLITSAFFVVQMFLTPLWSIASDRIGRKPAMMLGLLGSAICNVLFGLSRKSLLWSIATRALCGAVNGNLAIARTVVGEVAEAHGVAKGRAFSIFGFCHAAGWMLGPLIGGTFADPANRLHFPGPAGVFKTYPWLLPCLFGAVFNSVVCIAAFFWFEETAHLSLHVADLKPCPDSLTETTPLIAERGSINTNRDVAGQSRSMRTPQLCFLLSITFYFIHLICFDELFSLFAASSKTRGTGLSYQSGQIAGVLAFAGPSMLAALAVFPRVHARWGSTALYRVTAVIFALCYPLFSLMPRIESREMTRVMVVILVIIRYAALVVGLASFQILFSDLVEPRRLALMNGIAQSVGSLARAIGPSLGGFVWSWSLGNKLPAPLDYHACFIMLSLLGVGQGIATYGIPSDAALLQWRQELKTGRAYESREDEERMT